MSDAGVICLIYILRADRFGYQCATIAIPFLPDCANLPSSVVRGKGSGRLDEAEVKTLVRCGLRMPKSMGSQRFVSRVRYVVDAPEFFFFR